MTTRARAEADPSLRRILRDSAVIVVVVATLALALQRGHPSGALGVLAGATLVAFSYGAIRGGVNAIIRTPSSATGDASPGSRANRRRAARALAGVLARYGIIAVAAWAALVPLCAHPLGLFAGVSAPVLAIAIEAIRPTGIPSRRGRDRPPG